MARIGLFGGSFNPPTIAHKALADMAFKTLDLDQLWWIVSPHNPLKDTRTLAPFEDRFEMVQQVLVDHDHMVASDIEKQLGSSFTLNTVRHLRGQNPDDTLLLFIGADNWQNFHLWGANHAQILDLVSIVVFQRPGYEELMDCPSTHEFEDKFVENIADLKPYGSWAILTHDMMDVSATNVRHALSEGQKHPHIAEETWDYILQHNLYGAK